MKNLDSQTVRVESDLGAVWLNGLEDRIIILGWPMLTSLTQNLGI